jgi:hypothetical protein
MASAAALTGGDRKKFRPALECVTHKVASPSMSQDVQEDKRDWEDEGGAPAPEPTQKPKGSEIPVPTRQRIVDGFRVIVQPVRKKPKP